MSATPTHRGLSRADVELSRQKYGENVLTPPPRDPWWKQYFEKFEDPVIRILIIAAVIAIVAGIVDGKIAEGIGIIVAIFLATFLAFWNEYRANKEFDILNKSNDDVLVKVIREGNYTTIPRRELVVGDIAIVEVGEEIPTDGKLLEAVNLSVNEAKLTGEARPVEKEIGGVAPAEGTAYATGQLLRGTTVVDGYGTYEVTAVGDSTEIGKTLRESIEQNDEPSTLDKQLTGLSKIIGVVGFGIATLTFLALVGRGVVLDKLVLTGPEWTFVGIVALSLAVALVRVWLPIAFDALELAGVEKEPPAWLDAEGAMPWVKSIGLGFLLFAVLGGIGSLTGLVPKQPSDWLPHGAGREFLRDFMIAVTIIVVAVPEGLAMSVTLSLAYSMRKMTASNNLVRRMDACETIGAATVICSDKTGTLTLNEMRVFEGSFGGSTGAILPGSPMLRDAVIEAIAANTTAQLSREPGSSAKPVGNPTEGALLLWLDQLGTDYMAARQAFAVTTQWTFTTERKFMGTLGHSARSSQSVLHVKGAPEILLARCTTIQTPEGARPLTDADRRDSEIALKSYQSRGMRTLAFASKPQGAEGDQTLEDIAINLTWLGFVGIADPIRPEVPEAIAACRRAGVAVKIVTGDNPETAQEIARQIGLWDATDTADEHVTGAEFAAMSDETAKAAAGKLKVLSRARPADKLRLVNLLKQRGEVVAVTGDGVNDGPALNYADVGLAMGKTGTSVAKEASDIILLDDSFGSIITAIRWGRSLYENIQRFILFQLTINVAALGIADPIRPEVPEAIAACRRAGVAVKIVTGDNPETAQEIARQIGLWDATDTADEHVTGAEFAAMSDETAKAVAGKLKVLSRARPADKLRLVNLLKQRGEVVAVTGDGVNDGPALNYADVGLAMGKTGTSVAKEASDIILLDDSFGSIITAIRWGRSLYENIQRFILFQLTINVAALGIAMLGPFIGFELPLTVMQMLWINLIMDTFAALALATEPPNAGVLNRPPRDPAAFIVSRAMAINIFLTGAIFLAVLIGLIVVLKGAGELTTNDDPSRGGTILFTVFVMLQFWNLFNAKTMGRTGSVFPTLGNNPSFSLIAASILIGQILLVQFGGAVFRCVPLNLEDWLVIGGTTSIVLWAGEIIRLGKRIASRPVE